MSDSGEQLTYLFAGFRLDAQRRVMSRDNGEPVPLAPKVFDTLLYFVERPGQLIEKQRLLDAIWPNVVVEENNLNQCISTLRRVLGERPGEHRFIVTEPNRGYRFVAGVQALPASPQESASLSHAESVRLNEDAVRRTPVRKWGTARVLLLVAFALVLGAGVGWSLKHATAPIGTSANLGVVSLEVALPPHLLLSGGPPAEPGQRPSRPSFAMSPDGRYLVFAATDGATTRLYRRPMDQQQATPIPGTDGGSLPFLARQSFGWISRGRRAQESSNRRRGGSDDFNGWGEGVCAEWRPCARQLDRKRHDPDHDRRRRWDS